MPKGKVLTDIEKGQILAYHREKVLNREIARRLKRSDHVIRNFLKNPTDYETIKRKPKKSKVSGREKRRIVRRASNSVHKQKRMEFARENMARDGEQVRNFRLNSHEYVR